MEENECKDRNETNNLFDIVVSTRKVQRELRKSLRTDSPFIKMLIAFKPHDMTESDAYKTIRAAVACATTDIYHRYDLRQLQWPHKAAEYLDPDVTEATKHSLFEYFMSTSDCCMDDSMCIWLKAALNGMPVASRREVFDMVLTSWAIQAPSALELINVMVSDSMPKVDIKHYDCYFCNPPSYV